MYSTDKTSTVDSISVSDSFIIVNYLYASTTFGTPRLLILASYSGKANLSKRVVRSLSVVPREPINEILVKGGDIIAHERAVAAQELFVQYPVEPFRMGIEFGRTRVDVEVRQR